MHSAGHVAVTAAPVFDEETSAFVADKTVAVPAAADAAEASAVAAASAVQVDTVAVERSGDDPTGCVHTGELFQHRP